MGILALVWGGCAEPEIPRSEAPGEAPGVTWHGGVAALTNRHCAECHVAGGAAPFPLSTYDEAAAYADALAASTADRRMPPSNLDNSGECGTWSDARWLSDAEIATFTAWAEAGAPEGTARGAPPDPPAPWMLDRVDLSLEMPEAYTPAPEIVDDYRCFVLDPGLVEDRFVTGFGVRLGATPMVHHLTLFALDTPEADEEAARLDAADPGPGYACVGDTIVRSRWIVGSGPGDPGGEFPEGTGPRLRAGRTTVLQMHYNSANGTFPDRTAVDLRLEASVPHEAELERVAITELGLPPGQPDVARSDGFTLGADYYVWGLWPHMHALGRTLEVTARRGLEEHCVARVDRYRFHWQGFSFYEAPVELFAGDEVTLTCSWDTTSRTTTTEWGSGTEDEMCIAFFYVTRR